MVGLVCLLLGAGDAFTDWLRGSYETSGFNLSSDVGPASAASLIAMTVVTFAAVLALEGTPGNGRRIILMTSTLIPNHHGIASDRLMGILLEPDVHLGFGLVGGNSGNDTRPPVANGLKHSIPVKEKAKAP